MNFEALDGTKLILLMIAGASFAAVGLYLMVRPKAGDAAKIELFGLKFESSSAGLLVFIVGAAFLAVPLITPEKVSPSVNAAATGTAKVVGASSSSSTETSSTSLLPTDAEKTETEPNDRIQLATTVVFGQTATGDVDDSDLDWYVIELPNNPPDKITLQVRHVDGGDVGIQFLDGAEVLLKSGNVHSGSKYMESEVGSNKRFFVRLHHRFFAPARYELRLFQRQGG